MYWNPKIFDSDISHIHELEESCPIQLLISNSIPVTWAPNKNTFLLPLFKILIEKNESYLNFFVLCFCLFLRKGLYYLSVLEFSASMWTRLALNSKQSCLCHKAPKVFSEFHIVWATVFYILRKIDSHFVMFLAYG